MKKLITLFVLAYALVSGQTVQYLAHLDWTDTNNIDPTVVVTYNIYRAQGSCSATPLAFSKVGTSTTKSYVDSTVKPGLWCYQITSLANGAEAPPSNKADGVVPPFPVTSLKFSLEVKITAP